MVRVIALAGVAAWALSFALPTIDMGGRGGAAPGVLAAYFAFWLAPTVISLTAEGRIGAGEIPIAAFSAAYFPILSVLNVVVPLATFSRRRLARVSLAYAALASLVAIYPFASLWPILDLADGERVRLEIGYAVWLVSLSMVAGAAVARERLGRTKVDSQ